MSKIVHCSLSVRGALKWPASKRRRMFRYTASGDWMSASDARDVLLDYLSEGVELLPLVECNLHDPKTGCPGHEVSP